MRSFTTADQPGRCKRCLILEAHCICATVPTVRPKTQVVVVRHEREGWKSTGTARIAALAMPELELIDFCEDAEPARSRLPALVADAALLFPTPEAVPVAAASPAPRRLIVLDGTWRQTRRMYAKLPALHAVPKVTLPEKAPRLLRLRESKFEAGRSTIEAIAEALALLEGDEVAAPLFALHDAYVERVFRARGVWDQKRTDFEQGAADSDE